MGKRYMSIWFRYLKTDWFTRRQTRLSKIPFVLAAPSHGKMIITASNSLAEGQGVEIGMAVADARAFIHSLEVMDDKPELSGQLLHAFAEWCIRYSPVSAVDLSDGIILDITGCAHLWGGEEAYLKQIILRLRSVGYSVRGAIADTAGTAWAVARFGQVTPIIQSGQQLTALLSLPPASLRIENDILERLHKLGLRTIGDFIKIPAASLRRRFGAGFIQRLNQAIGYEEEIINPVQPEEPYQQRLPCLEPISTATGIQIALQNLLEVLCNRLRQEGKVLRRAVFKGYRVDGKIEKIEIGTNHPSHNVDHLFRLFEIKLESIEPALGIELFVLEAFKVEDTKAVQEKLWQQNGGLAATNLSELLDRIANKFGAEHICRYVPEEHYWPERSIKTVSSLQEGLATQWRTDIPRPVQLLSTPLPIQVTAPIPDYPPMLFTLKGKLHKIIKADGPERIEQEWWLQQGQHRDYYCVEDEEGHRYWLFRAGHYTDKAYKWFIHGYFS
jgi:protein ImuB